MNASVEYYLILFFKLTNRKNAQLLGITQCHWKQKKTELTISSLSFNSGSFFCLMDDSFLCLSGIFFCGLDPLAESCFVPRS